MRTSAKIQVEQQNITLFENERVISNYENWAKQFNATNKREAKILENLSPFFYKALGHLSF